MLPDSHDVTHISISRQEPAAVRSLPLITRALCTHFHLFVDPMHGCLELDGLGVADALCANAPGALGTADLRRVKKAVSQLLTRRVLIPCRVFRDRPTPITLGTHRSLELSPWLEDPNGSHVVVADWVPRLHRLSPAHAMAWHQARQDALAHLTPPLDLLPDDTPPARQPGAQIPATTDAEVPHAGR